jgi:oxygen-independent coproporphyrinogen-3 oxidase
LPGDDAGAEMYERMLDRFAAAGHEHYEISNWSWPGRASRHNSKYWRDCNVAAFGVSAHGVWDGRRTENPRDLAGYLGQSPGSRGVAADPPATERARLGEIMMLALRRVPGGTWDELTAWAGRDVRQYYAAELINLTDNGLIAADDAGVRLTRRGLLLADAAMAEFF